jgi:hypothetical protein
MHWRVSRRWEKNRGSPMPTAPLTPECRNEAYQRASVGVLCLVMEGSQLARDGGA